MSWIAHPVNGAIRIVNLPTARAVLNFRFTCDALIDFAFKEPTDWKANPI